MNDGAVINWDTLYKKEAPKLIGVCRRYVGNISAAEDIVQDSFLSAIEKADQFKGNGSIEAWIYRIVVNSALQYLKSNKIVQVPIDKFSDLVGQGANSEDDRSTRKTIEDAGFSQEDLLAALDYLPEHHRIVFNLYVMEGFKHKNIAKILDISIGTSKSHLARARKKIVQILLIKAEQKKKRRRAVVIWLFPESCSYIDRLYRKKFRDFEIPPNETFVAKGIKMPYKKSFSFFKTPLFYFGTAGVIALSLFFANDIFRTPPSPMEPPVFKKDSIEEIYSVKEKNDTVPMVTKTKVLNDSIVKIKPDTIRNIVRKPVYIRKTIVVRNTIYEVYDARLKYEKIIPIEAVLPQDTSFFMLKTATISENEINRSEAKSNNLFSKKIGINMTDTLKTVERSFGRNEQDTKPTKEIFHTDSLNSEKPGKRIKGARVLKYFAAATLSAATTIHSVPAKAQRQESNELKTEEIAVTKKIPGQISFLYPLGTSGKSSKNTAYNLSVNILPGVTGDINGAEFGGVSNFNTGNMTGAQFAGINNLSLGTVTGTQFAGITNISKKEVDGVQFAGITNIVGNNFSGAQFGGIANFTNGKMKGVQVAGILNYTKGNLIGVQIGLINYADKSQGFQLGLINCMDTIPNGFSFGLLNLPRHGFYDEFELAFSDYANTALSYKAGYKKFYTIFTAGTNYIKNNLFLFGVGFGHIKEISPKFWLQPEIQSFNYFPNDFKDTQYNSSNRIKLGLRYNFSEKLAISFAPGVYANVLDNRKGETYDISFIRPVSVINGDINNVELGVGFSVGLIFY